MTGLDSAMAALREIVEEGEGLPHSIWDSARKLFGGSRARRELAHYFRFTELLAGQYFGPDDTPATGPTGPLLPVDWDASYDMAPNPKADDYPPAATSASGPSSSTGRTPACSTCCTGRSTASRGGWPRRSGGCTS